MVWLECEALSFIIPQKTVWRMQAILRTVNYFRNVTVSVSSKMLVEFIDIQQEINYNYDLDRSATNKKVICE